MRILEIYYCLRHPDVLLNPTTRQAFATPPAWMLNESRSHFYDVMLDAAEDMRVVSDDGSQTAA